MPSWIFALYGLILAVLAVPLVLRRVPPNALYGLRVPATFRDDSVWYDANAASGRDMLIYAAVSLLAAFLLPAAGLRDFAIAIAWIVIAAGGALVVAIIGWRRANRMFRERRPS
jgi:uncharacterized membrane protein